MIVFETSCLNKSLNLWVGIPMLALVLIAADMNVRIGEELCHLAQESVEHFIQGFIGGIECRIEDTPPVLDLIWTGLTSQFRVRNKPTRRVARHVELGDHPNTAHPRILYDLAHLFLCEIKTVRTFLMQFWIFFTLNSETLIFSQMKVQDVEFHCRHCIEITFDDLHWLPVTANIDH